MDTTDFNLIENLKGLKINEEKEINILLLGQSGIGKSTFVNSVINYLSFRNFSQAVDRLDKLTVLIPSQFGIGNKHNQIEEVTIGGTAADDENEHLEIGESATRDVRSYIFHVGNGQTKVRLIDSPGIGDTDTDTDTRGLEKDAENVDKILDYIGQLEELHAVCLVFNPTHTRITPFFEHRLQGILSRLNKSASRNLVFLFTNSKGTNFTPGDTFPLLRKIRDKIKTENDVDILLDENENVFCFENDAFKYLAALKRGVEFSKEQRKDYLRSWNQSSKECLRLISYIVGDEKRPPLAPHLTQGTVSINEARRLITNLSQPLADITQLIQDNINVLQRHQRTLSSEEDSLTDLKKRLYIPVVNLKVTELTQPVTVCTSSKCATNIRLEGVNLTHYGQRCHEPCYLTTVKGNQIGDAGLVNCACIDQSTKSCKKCTCDFSIHTHVYYLTTPVSEKKEDAVVKRDILNREEAIRSKNKLIEQIEQRREEYKKEREKIIVCAAQFAHFLQNNAITPINDCYETYIKYLIKREEGLGADADQETLNQLNDMLDRYLETRQAFDRSLELQKQLGDENSSSFVDPETIKRSIKKLYQLRHTGAKIEELVEKQTVSRRSEHDHLSEVVDIVHSIHLYKTKAKKNKEVKEDVKAAEGCPPENKANESKNFVNKVWNHQHYKRSQRDRSNHRARDRSNHRPISQNLQRLNYSPPPPYEQDQQPPYEPHQPLYQPAPAACCGENCHTHGPHAQSQIHQIEVKINQNPCSESHCHQCSHLSQPPRAGYSEPQCGQVEPQAGHLGPQGQGPRDGFGGNQQGGFRQEQYNKNRWRQNKQGGPKFYNKQNRNWGSQNNSDNNQDRPAFQGPQKFNNNQNRNEFAAQNRPNYQNKQKFQGQKFGDNQNQSEVPQPQNHQHSLNDNQGRPNYQNKQKFNDRRSQKQQMNDNQNQQKFKTDNQNQTGASLNQEKVNDNQNQNKVFWNQQKFGFGYSQNQEKANNDTKIQTGACKNQEKANNDNKIPTGAFKNQEKANNDTKIQTGAFKNQEKANNDNKTQTGVSKNQENANNDNQTQTGAFKNQEKVNDNQNQNKVFWNQQKFGFGYSQNQEKANNDTKIQTGACKNQEKANNDNQTQTGACKNQEKANNDNKIQTGAFKNQEKANNDTKIQTGAFKNQEKANNDNKTQTGAFKNQERANNDNQTQTAAFKNQEKANNNNQNQQKFDFGYSQNQQKSNQTQTNGSQINDKNKQIGVSQNQEKVNDNQNQNKVFGNQQKFRFGSQNQEKTNNDNKIQTAAFKNQEKANNDNQNQQKFGFGDSQNQQKASNDNQTQTGVFKNQQKVSDNQIHSGVSANQQKANNGNQTHAGASLGGTFQKPPDHSQGYLINPAKPSSENRVGGFVMIDPDYSRAGRSAVNYRRAYEEVNKKQVPVAQKKGNECVIC